MSTPNQCPCGSQAPYESCCAMYHNNLGSAPTAEALMRSRYSAFALAKFDYIASTQKLVEQVELTGDDIAQGNGDIKWTKLVINETHGGGSEDTEGMVSFTAHFEENGKAGRLSERSLFEKIDGAWFYTAGEHEVKADTVVNKDARVGRNDPCVCGSGKKYKKCCG